MHPEPQPPYQVPEALPFGVIQRLYYEQVEREFLIGNLLVRIHCIIVMIRWTGLAPREFDLYYEQVYLEHTLTAAERKGSNLKGFKLGAT